MRAMLLAVAVAATAAAGCDVNPFCIDCGDPGAGGDGGGPGGADAATDGGPIADASDLDACVPSGAVEQCNGRDDDCDGDVDEDAAMVGETCGTDVGPCTTGTYACTDGMLVCGGGAVLPQPESCNGADDDCDGMVDDGNPGGGVSCGSDVGACQRGVTACSGGMVVCSGEIPPQPELCDIVDNDCDGFLDEGNPEGGAACGMGTGDCMPGTEQCIGGALVCVGGEGPSFELCDGADNDCDGMIDENYDFDNDPNHCGDCTTVCMTDNAQPGCSMGDCEIAFCFTGWWDDNEDWTDGCEYPCDFAGAEVCNGQDDDCDGDTDEGLTAPDICNQIGECAGAVATCEGMAGWVCGYGATVSTDPMTGEIVPEADCDGLDNDCDGVADDAFPMKGDPCQRGMGACTTTGSIVCNAAMDGVVCNAADPPAGSAEVCDGLDNDCDGVPDDGAPDDWVMVNGSLWVYRYEASRPDADDTTQGTMSHRPCSGTNRLPWTNITQPDAEAQCASIGARLCTESEWETICESTTGSCTWSYSSSCTTYDGSRCNGNDYDFVPGGSDQDGLLPSESLSACYSSWTGSRRVYDLSGNVKEWTVQRSAGVNPLRGGSYNNTAAGISCQFDFTVADDTFQFQNVGFRCCRSTAPP